MSHLTKRFPRYSRLLSLYPPAYRQKYSEQMLQTLADMLDDGDNTRSLVWIRTVLDFPFSLLKQNVLTMGDIMTHETPDYVRHSSLAGALLLTPFFTFLALDSVTSHSLYSSWFWHPWVIAGWLIIMPAVAAIICGSAFIYWSCQRRQGFVKNLFDWRRNWPLLGIVIIGLTVIVFAFGHDSVHCVSHNPIPELRYWHTTLTCLRNG